jgi:hypothetical protein
MSNKFALWVLVFGVGFAGIISSFAPVSPAQTESLVRLNAHPAAG